MAIGIIGTNMFGNRIELKVIEHKSRGL